MARGWESKSVEDQMTAAEDKTPRKAQISDDERTKAAARANLSAARARVMQQLQTACDARYRAQLEAALETIDGQLIAVDRH